MSPRHLHHQPYWLYGTHAVWTAWLNPERQIKKLRITETHTEEYESYRAQADRLKLKRPVVEWVEKRQLDKLCGENAVHQGIAAEVSPLPDISSADLCRSVQVRDHALILMLDQVTDPHNVGAIIRSAAAFGALAIVMQDRHAPFPSGLLGKTACGGLEHIQLVYVTNLSDTLNALHEAGCTSIALDERGEHTLNAIPHEARTVLVLGAEGKGLRQKVRETCTHLARLPTQAAFGALNVSNAAAVGLYELASRSK